MRIRTLAGAFSYVVGTFLVEVGKVLDPELAGEPLEDVEDSVNGPVSVELSDEAKRMIEEGMSARPSRPQPASAEPLAGSAAARARAR